MGACRPLNKERYTFETLREHLLRRYRLREGISPEDALADALYVLACDLFGSLLELHQRTPDGWRELFVMHEDEHTLRAIGILYFLPRGELPLEFELSSRPGGIRCELLVGAEDPWSSLSESKRWKSVYLYATTGAAPTWTWQEGIEADL